MEVEVEAIGSLELCMCLLYPPGKSIQLALVGLRGGTAAIPRHFVGWAFIRLLLANRTVKWVLASRLEAKPLHSLNPWQAYITHDNRKRDTSIC